MDPKNRVPELCLSSREFFAELVEDALTSRQIRTLPTVSGYLVELLNSYITTDKLFDEEDTSGRKTRDTLAEMFLRAGQVDHRVRLDILKKLGDTSLYVSGFFGDSLSRKIVDIDYYAEMGGTAYATLAGSVREDTTSRMYREFAERFLEFVDALTYIRQKTSHEQPNNLLRLFDTYSQGSKLAGEQILEKGIILPARKKAQPQ